GRSERETVGIEATAISHDITAHRVTQRLHTHTNTPIGIFSRPVANRVAEGLGECGAEVEADAAGRQRTGGEIVRNQLDRVTHHPEIARDVERHRILREIELEAQKAASASRLPTMS